MKAAACAVLVLLLVGCSGAPVEPGTTNATDALTGCWPVGTRLSVVSHGYLRVSPGYTSVIESVDVGTVVTLVSACPTHSSSAYWYDVSVGTKVGWLRADHLAPLAGDAGSPAPDAGSSGPAPDAGSGSPAPDAGSGGAPSGFVTRCGLGLCVNGQPFRVHGATAYGSYSSPQSEVSYALYGGVNLLEIVEFETQYHTLSDCMSSATWTRVDNFIATAAKAGLHVMLNLSSYGQSLQVAGYVPTAVDWNPYLTFIANRVNSVTGVKYANDPTIAMVELWGEIPAPNYSNPAGTTQQVTDFYKRSLAEWKALDSNHLINTGGFSYLNDPNSGIDWKTIMSDPNDDLCAIEINSSNDRDITVPMVTQYCQTLGKPWFLSAWSSCYTTTGPQFSSDIDHWTSDSQMATHAEDMYGVERDLPQYYVSSHPSPSYAAVGSDFWNLGVKGTAPSCDLSLEYFPLTWSVVQEFAH